MKEATPEPSPIKGLPFELICMILWNVSGVHALQAARQSSPVFYRVIPNLNEGIVRRVFFNHVHPSILPEANVALAASRIQNTPRGEDVDLKTFALLLAYETQGPIEQILISGWSLRDAIEVGQLHCAVDIFTRRFITKALHSRSGSYESAAPVTRLERLRIERAFYRFEIYCNMFRPASSNYGGRDTFRSPEKYAYFRHYEPWEVEQIGCIHDFLVRTIEPGKLDVLVKARPILKRAMT